MSRPWFIAARPDVDGVPSCIWSRTVKSTSVDVPEAATGLVGAKLKEASNAIARLVRN